MLHHPAPRTGAAIRTGPLRAARTLLAEADAAASPGTHRDRALARVALGRLLREDGLRGLSHPTDPRLLRPGLGGSVVGVVVAALLTWVVGGFALLGVLLLLTTLLTLGVRLRSVIAGGRLVHQGRQALAGLPGAADTTATEREAVEAFYPRFAGMLSWTLPRRSIGDLHDHDSVG